MGKPDIQSDGSVSIEKLFDAYSHLIIDDIHHHQFAIPHAVADLMPQFKAAGVTHVFLELKKDHQDKIDAFMVMPPEADALSKKDLPADPADPFAIGSDLRRIINACKKYGIRPVAMDVRWTNPAADAFLARDDHESSEDIEKLSPAERKEYDRQAAAFDKERRAADYSMVDAISRSKPEKSVILIGAGHTEDKRDFDELLEARPGFAGKVVRARARAMPDREKTQIVPHTSGTIFDLQWDIADRAPYLLEISTQKETELGAKRYTEMAAAQVLQMGRSDVLRSDTREIAHRLKEARQAMESGDYDQASLDLIGAEFAIKRNPSMGDEALLRILKPAQEYTLQRRLSNYVQKDPCDVLKQEVDALRTDRRMREDIIEPNVSWDKRCLPPAVIKDYHLNESIWVAHPCVDVNEISPPLPGSAPKPGPAKSGPGKK